MEWSVLLHRGRGDVKRMINISLIIEQALCLWPVYNPTPHPSPDLPALYSLSLSPCVVWEGLEVVVAGGGGGAHVRSIQPFVFGGRGSALINSHGQARDVRVCFFCCFFAFVFCLFLLAGQRSRGFFCFVFRTRSTSRVIFL